MSSTDRDESGDEPEVVTPQLQEKSQAPNEDALPEKSRVQYNQCFTIFMEWLGQRGDATVSEENLLAYFEMMKNQWKPSTAWSKYSMLKTTISTKLGINISKFRKLNSFLTKNSKGFSSQKSKVLDPEHVQRFLTEAPDSRYLAVKVALIFGITGACRRDELKKITVQDIEHHNNMVLVRIRQSNSNTPRKFTVDGDFYEIFKRYEALRPKNAWSSQFFLCVRDGKCTQQVIGINTFGAMPKLIAEYLGLKEPEKYTGHSFRRTSATMLAEGGADLQTLKRHQSRRRFDRPSREDDEYSIANSKRICTQISSSTIMNREPAIKIEVDDDITIMEPASFGASTSRILGAFREKKRTCSVKEKYIDAVDAATQTDFPVAESRESHPEILFCWQNSHLHEASTQTTIVRSAVKEETTSDTDEAARCSRDVRPAVISRMSPGIAVFGGVKSEETMNRMCGVSRGFHAKLLLLIPTSGSTKFLKKFRRENLLFLFLMKMKLGLSFDDLGGFFGVSATTAASIFFDVLEILFAKTRGWIAWPSRDSMPVTFSSYPDCRAIIDVAEVRCEEPANVEQRIIMHSQSRGCFTTKYFVAIGPNGLVAFVSRGYGGRTTDECVASDSGFVALVEPGDEIMTDKDFPLLRTELARRQCSLVTQTFPRDPLLTGDDEPEDDLMAFVRDHADEAIERIKEYRILELVNVELFPYIDEILFITCVLANNKPIGT